MWESEDIPEDHVMAVTIMLCKKKNKDDRKELSDIRIA